MIILFALVGYLAARAARGRFAPAALPWIALGGSVLASVCYAVATRHVDADPRAVLEAAVLLGTEAGALAIAGKSALGPMLRGMVRPFVVGLVPVTLAPMIDGAITHGLDLLLGPDAPTATAPVAKPPSVVMLVLCAALSVGAGGCGASGCAALGAQIASVASDVLDGAKWVRKALGKAETTVDAYYARHPNSSAEGRARAAVAGVEVALAVLDEAARAGEDTAALVRAVIDRWTVLLDVLGELGVLDAAPPFGGAETDAPDPVPVTLPTVADVAARLGQ